MSTDTSAPLPSGWSTRINAAFHAPEYISPTGATHFLHPSAPAPPAVSLPWTSKADDKGRIFYSNHDRRTTSWKNPVEEARLVAMAKARGQAMGEEDWKVGYWVGEPGGDEWWVDYRTGKLSWSSGWKEGDDRESDVPV